MKRPGFLFVLIGIIVLDNTWIPPWTWTYGQVPESTVEHANAEPAKVQYATVEPAAAKSAASTDASAGDAAKLRAEFEEILRAAEALPASERLTAWELDFRGEVLAVAHGKECFYYLLHLPNAFPDAPGQQTALPAVSANLERSGWQQAVVCLDLKNGRIRWSREVNGLANLAVDPGTDVLYLYGAATTRCSFVEQRVSAG